MESKKLFGFGANKPAFEALTGAAQGSSFDISVTKNDAGYNDWTSCKPAGAAQSASTGVASQSAGTVSGATTVKSTYETPDERAKKQVYIIRQSSITSAISSLAVGAKSALKPEDVLVVAEAYYNWVTQSPEAAVKQDLFELPNDMEVM